MPWVLARAEAQLDFARGWHMPEAYATLVAAKQVPDFDPGERMSSERSVRLFRNGRNQAVRIPRDLELPGNEATIRKEGAALVITPARTTSLLATLKKLSPLRDKFPPIKELPIGPVEL